MRIRNTFAGGPGGWEVACSEMGWQRPDGWEILPIARATRDVLGHTTVGADVTELKTYPGEYKMDLSSPPCPGFSIAGHGKGRMDFDVIRAGIKLVKAGWPLAEVREYVHTMALDHRTSLVLEPLRIALEGESGYLAWEQVPTVLPVWEMCASILRTRGWDVITGVINAEEYGVPQVRKRAVLMARRDGRPLRLPRATHQRYGDTAPLTWLKDRYVTMAEALGWGMTERPSMTASAGGTGSGGGVELFGNGARRGMRAEMEAGRWLDDGIQRWSTSGKSVRVTTEDVLRIQSFPATLPIQGRIGERTLQVGNAIPVKMAKAILTAVTA